MRPLRKVGEVEVQVICLGQRVEVGGVEFEDIHRMKGAQGSHFQGKRFQVNRDRYSCPVLLP